MKFSQLKKFAKTCNVRYEMHPITSKGAEYYDPFKKEWITPEYVLGYEIGLNNISGRTGVAEYQWVWFSTYNENIDDNTEFFFRERYSMNVGKSYKSIKEELNAYRTINRRMAI